MRAPRAPNDAQQAIGDTSPTAPKPPPKSNYRCGTFGAILRTVIAVVVAKAFPNPGGILGSAVSRAAANVVSQGINLAVGLQRRFDSKQVALAATSGAAEGVSDLLFGRQPLPVIGDAAKAATTNVIAQKIGQAVGLQQKFSWSAVASAAVIGGVASAVSRSLPASLPSVASDAITGSAAAIAGAGTRSLLTGTSFGDNLTAVLPDVIGSTIGNAVARGLTTPRLKRDKSVLSGGDEVTGRVADAAPITVDQAALGATLNSISRQLDAQLKGALTGNKGENKGRIKGTLYQLARCSPIDCGDRGLDSEDAGGNQACPPP